jgi:hypothetical protein
MKMNPFVSPLLLCLVAAGCGARGDGTATNASSNTAVDHSVINVLPTSYRHGTKEVIELRADGTYLETLTTKKGRVIKYEGQWDIYPAAPNDQHAHGDQVRLRHWLDGGRIDAGKPAETSHVDMVFDRSLFLPAKK